MAPLVWLVTGSTSGIGAALIEHIIARGDSVIASGRKVEEKLGHLKSDKLALLELDITESAVEISTQINKAWNIFGHIDVLMNNAGMSAMKSAEEAK
jgi:NADP-dependent 3-hydroxy acid dehydrogenase YdfG